MIFTESNNKYDSSASTTYKAYSGADSAFTIGYSVGGVSGTKATDTVSVIQTYNLRYSKTSF